MQWIRLECRHRICKSEAEEKWRCQNHSFRWFSGERSAGHCEHRLGGGLLCRFYQARGVGHNHYTDINFRICLTYLQQEKDLSSKSTLAKTFWKCADWVCTIILEVMTPLLKHDHQQCTFLKLNKCRFSESKPGMVPRLSYLANCQRRLRFSQHWRLFMENGDVRNGKLEY